MKKLNKSVLSAVLSASLTVTSVPFSGAGIIAADVDTDINAQDSPAVSEPAPAGRIELPFESSLKGEEAPAAEKPVFEYEENEDGTLTVKTYNGTSLEVVIPDKADGKTVTAKLI